VHRIQIPDGASAGGTADPTQPCLEFSPAGARPEILLARLTYTRTPEEPVAGALAVRLPSNDKHSVLQPDGDPTAPRGETLIPISGPTGDGNRARIEQRLRRAAGKVFRPQFVPRSLDDDPGMDELNRIELSMAVKDEFGIEVPPVERKALNTLADWI